MKKPLPIGVVGRMVIFLGLLGCSQSLQYSGGSGSDVETKVIGCALDSSGTPVANATVHLRPDKYVVAVESIPATSSGDCLDTITDEKGRFFFNSVREGSYVVEINNRKGLAAALRCTIGDSDPVADMGTHRLVRTGVVHGIIPSELMAERKWFVQIYGLERIAQVDSTSGIYCFSDIPAGRYSLRLTTDDPAIEPVVSDTLTVGSGDTVSAPTYPTWKHHRKLTLNTTASGADVKGNVTDFPLLIRLTSDRFDFSQAKNGGSDVRFTKADGSPLPYEIEEWDAAKGLAAIWVKIDTVYGNNDSQYIVMFWGNADAASQSAPAAVFDTSAGFAGVWHLGHTDGARTPDATANGFYGTSTATAPVSGIIGTAQTFDGRSSMIRIEDDAISKLNFLPDGAFSVSAWVKATDSADNQFHAIVFKSNFQYGLQIDRDYRWEFVTYRDKSGWEGSHAPASSGEWHLITGVWIRSKQYLFVDGLCADSGKAFKNADFALEKNTPLEIGHCPDGGLDPDRFFCGVIDEVRISNLANSADWIRLCYMNQKEQDALIKW